MANSNHESSPASDVSSWPPGTILLQQTTSYGREVNLHPTPTSDPNDPLNWSTWRKSVNFTLVSFYVFMTFVQLDTGFTAWQAYQNELPDLNVDFLNGAAAAGYVGLAVGCIFFIPLVHKYGRRPMYIFSILMQLGSCIWAAVSYTRGDFVGNNFLAGLGGAISETIAQITIADLFFVHHHAVMNGFYHLATFAGTYLGPVASGYMVDGQGWRWMWWWWAIIFAVNLILVIFFFEESKFVPSDPNAETEYEIEVQITADEGPEKPAARTHVDASIPMNGYAKRLALVTRTEGSVWPDMVEPMMILYSMPAVTYAALTYGSLLAWFAIMISIQSTYLFLPPYNFTAGGVGLMNLAPFIGTVLAFFFGGYLNDKCIMWLSRRNHGVYEPEMRLWLALPMAILTPAGILMLGVGMANGLSWPVLAVGFGLFGFGLVVAGNVALAYTMDCYHNIVGNALVGVVFMRNTLSVVVLFALSPWIASMGLQNMQILTAVFCFVFLLLPVPLLIWGKKFRIATAKRYETMARRHATYRSQ